MKSNKAIKVLIGCLAATILLWPTKYHYEPIKGCQQRGECSFQYKVEVPLFSDGFWNLAQRRTQLSEEKRFNIYKQIAAYALLATLSFVYIKQELNKKKGH